MKIKILASANRDLIEGYRFYENQSTGLGEYFLDSLYSDVESLIITAGVYPVYFVRYHRLLSKRFPFAVYYRLKNRTVFIHAILDCRKNPAWIRSKLTDTDQ